MPVTTVISESGKRSRTSRSSRKNATGQAAMSPTPIRTGALNRSDNFDACSYGRALPSVQVPLLAGLHRERGAGLA